MDPARSYRYRGAFASKIIEDYDQKCLVARVNGDQDVDAVFRDVVAALSATREEEVLEANRALTEAACREDWGTCSKVRGRLLTSLRYLERSWCASGLRLKCP